MGNTIIMVERIFAIERIRSGIKSVHRCFRDDNKF